MRIAEQPDGSAVSTIYYAGIGEPQQPCPDRRPAAEHLWQDVVTNTEPSECGRILTTQCCSRCKWYRAVLRPESKHVPDL